MVNTGDRRRGARRAEGVVFRPRPLVISQPSSSRRAARRRHRHPPLREPQQGHCTAVQPWHTMVRSWSRYRFAMSKGVTRSTTGLAVPQPEDIRSPPREAPSRPLNLKPFRARMMAGCHHGSAVRVARAADQIMAVGTARSPSRRSPRRSQDAFGQADRSPGRRSPP